MGSSWGSRMCVTLPQKCGRFNEGLRRCGEHSWSCLQLKQQHLAELPHFFASQSGQGQEGCRVGKYCYGLR